MDITEDISVRKPRTSRTSKTSKTSRFTTIKPEPQYDPRQIELMMVTPATLAGREKHLAQIKTEHQVCPGSTNRKRALLNTSNALPNESDALPNE
eukprot:3486494-Pyramimonas_sp.AAC.1